MNLMRNFASDSSYWNLNTNSISNVQKINAYG